MPAVLVTGANRGLGLTFAVQYAAENWQVFAACRDPSTADNLQALCDAGAAVEILELDVTEHASIDCAKAAIGDAPIDVLINNAGVFGPNAGADNDWRQNFGHMDYEVWQDVLRINTFGPFRMAEVFVDNIARSEQKKLITISSNLGSIGDPERGMHFAYRSSKAAINMAMATLADELKPQDIVVALFDPGWCRTDMGGPGADLDPAESVARMRALIDELSIADSGSFLRHDGYRHPW